MEEWSDIGIVLSTRKYGEKSLILDAFTKKGGRQRGLVKLISEKNRFIFQEGNLLELNWSARLEEHLGTYKADIITSYAGQVLQDSLLLSGLTSLCSIASLCLPEREPFPFLWEITKDVLKGLVNNPSYWVVMYAKWEVFLLAELGFALDLTKCAVTGQTDELCYVSPKTGRAVSRTVGEEYKTRLLPLPSFLLDIEEGTAPDKEEVIKAFTLTSYFLDKHVLGGKQPPSRLRFLEKLHRL